MRSFLHAQLVPSFVIFGMMALGAGCGGKDGDVDTDTDTDTETDTDPDTDTDTDPPITSGFARVVNLITDPAGIDITLNDAATPLVEDLPTGGNTDATGDYAPFPGATYTVTASHGGTELAELTADVQVGEYYTVLFYGSEAGGALDPALGPNATFVVDDPADVMAGHHHLKVFHFAPGVGSVDIYLDDTEAASGLAYSAATDTLMPADGQELGIDVDGDGTPDKIVTPAFADEDWSYIYILPDGAGGLTVLQHIRGVANTPL